MVLQFNSDLPLLWRTPDTLQFGIERVVSIASSPTKAEEMVFAALSRGASRGALSVVGAEHGMGDEDVERLLERFAPVIGPPVPQKPLARRRIDVAGSPAPVEAITTLLRELGARVPPRDGDGRPRADIELAVVVAEHAVFPPTTAAWLASDTPHLIVVFGDQSVRVGPLVEPGAGPCAHCLDLARTDADPAWPAIAAQAVTHRASTTDPLAIASAAVVVARLVVERLCHGRADARGRVIAVRRPGLGEWAETQRVRPHPRCACRSLQGNATEGGPPLDAIRPPPTRETGATVPG
jgi:bacteriocin biosynthesis cyclodehydratase domain-containing protein